MKKFTQEYVETYLFKKYGLKLLSTYTGLHDDLDIQKGEYKIRTSFVSARDNKMCGVFSSKNIYFKENIEKYLSKNFPNVKFVDAKSIKKSGKSRLIVFMIDANGHDFCKDITHLLDSNNKELCCKRCSRDNQTENHRKNMTKKWLDSIDNDKFIILNDIDYLTSESRVDMEDIETGYRYSTNIRNTKNANPFNAFSNDKYYLYNLVIYGVNNGFPSTPIDIVDKNSSHNIIEFKCSCGNVFQRSVHKWMNGSYLCPKCSAKTSQYERKVFGFLQDNNIKFMQEYRFNSCVDQKPLPFDFFLVDFNALIEIDGQQHYQPISFDGNTEKAIKRFELQKKHDKIKTKFCNDNNINLLRLSYKDFNDKTWEIKIINFIKPLSCNET